ncbi:Dabb family protein [Clostridium sp. P21]|uniref:Dabb family protein n=1 Tax=Clostridium muellerianum TaxID=2716538 RepID=A0A7Y0HLT2_9CLOT|nr:Dabb family protein [Clostridium muellerianum]NMM62279.1 Dabb family protein [Clostridium muellerianum]
MFTHIVFFRLKDKSPENVEKAKDILKAMEGKIPQLKELTVGKDVVHSARSFDVGIITKFNSQKEMDEYQVHPFHVNEVLANLKPMLESSAAIDFEE